MSTESVNEEKKCLVKSGKVTILFEAYIRLVCRLNSMRIMRKFDANYAFKLLE